MLFHGSAVTKRPIATAAAAAIILLAGSTAALAKDGNGKGNGGGGGGGGGGGQRSAQRESRQMNRAPQQQPRQVQKQAQKQQPQREVRSAPRAEKPANQQQIARSQQRSINQQNKQIEQQAQQAARAQQRTLNQQNKQAQEAVRLQEKLAQKEVKQEKQAFLQDQRDQKRALEQARIDTRKTEKLEARNLNQLEQQQKNQARDLKRAENRAADDARREANRAAEAMRRQNKADQKLNEHALAGGRNPRNPEKFNDRGNRADNGVLLDGQRRGRGRNNIDIDGDGNTVIKNKVKVVNKYYGHDSHGWRRGWYDNRCDWRPRHRWYDCDDDNWSIHIGFNSWGGSSFGFSYNWYDDDCWRPCRPSWCGPRWYYRSYCWPTFVHHCPPTRVYYAYPSYVCHPVYSYTSGVDYGYYGSVGVSTYTNTSYAYTDASDDINPFAAATSVETFDTDDGAMDYDWDQPSYTYSDTYTPSSSPTAEMARNNDGSISGDISRSVKPDRPFDNEPASIALNEQAAWQLLEDAHYQEALTRFSAAAQADSGDAGAKVGYALAAAMLGREDTAAWAMRRAFVLDAETVGFIPESAALRRDLDKLSNRLSGELAAGRHDAMVNVSDRWFLLAAVEYLRRDTIAAKTALERSVQTDQVRDSTANFQRLLDRGG